MIEELEWKLIEDADLKIILSNDIGISHVDVLKSKADLEVISLNSSTSEIGSYSETAPDIDIGPTDLAYVIYTSGSTGRPKGVMNEHAGLVNRLKWAQSYFQLNPDDVILQKIIFCFDVSVWELLWPHRSRD